MSLATEETKPVTFWRSADGEYHSTKRLAEVNSIAYRTGFSHEMDDFDYFLKKLFTHPDIRQWLLEQMPDQPSPKPRFDILKLQDFPSKMAEYCDKCGYGGNPGRINIMREMATLMEQDGYRLIKL